MGVKQAVALSSKRMLDCGLDGRLPLGLRPHSCYRAAMAVVRLAGYI